MSDFRQSVWDPRKGPVTYIAAGYLLALSSNLFSSVLQKSAIAAWTFAVLPPLVVLGLVVSGRFPRLFARTPDIEILATARACRGLVVLVSLRDGVATADAAARYHARFSRDLYVWMLASAQSRAAAVELKTRLVQEDILQDERVRFIDLSDADFENPERVRTAIEERVYQKLPDDIEEHDVIVDVTGGRKTTSAGAFLAALPAGRRIEVNKPSETDEAGRGTKPGDPMEIVIDYRLKKLTRKSR